MKLKNLSGWIFLVLGFLLIIDGLTAMSTKNEARETKKILNHTSILAGGILGALGLIMLHLSSKN